MLIIFAIVFTCCLSACSSHAFSWEKHWNEYFESIKNTPDEYFTSIKNPQKSLQKGPIKIPIDPKIKESRMGIIKIRTKPFADIKVEQQSHDFWFGTAISEKIFDNDFTKFTQKQKEKYKEIVVNNFNSAVPENAMKWDYIEYDDYDAAGNAHRPGQPWYEHADEIVNWCQVNGIRLRGHCVFWAVEKDQDEIRHVQKWLAQLPIKDLSKTVENRATKLLTRYKGRVHEYDVNNEMLKGNFYARKLGDNIRIKMFEWCQNADSQAILYINDYNILNGKEAKKYEELILKLLRAGAPIGGIGLQGHFTSWKDIFGRKHPGKVNAKKVKKALDRLSRFANLPIKITEFDIENSDPNDLAEGIFNLFNVCFAHPSVEGIMLWGFWEEANWLKDREDMEDYKSLWDANFNPTLAGKVYLDLTWNQWFTNWQGKADKYGVCEVPAFFGFHLIEINGQKMSVSLQESYEDKTLLLNDDQVFVIVIKPANPSDKTYVPTGANGPVAKIGNRVPWWKKFLIECNKLLSWIKPKEVEHTIEISEETIPFSYPHKPTNIKTPIILFNKIEEAGKEIIIINESDQRVEVKPQIIEGIKVEGTDDEGLLTIENNKENKFKIFPVSGYSLIDKFLTMDFKVGDTDYTERIPLQVTTSEQ